MASHNNSNSQNQLSHSNAPPFNLQDPQLQARFAFMAQQQAASNGGAPASQDQLASMAAAMGNIQGQNREAIMKQLQALQTSHARTKQLAASMGQQQPSPSQTHSGSGDQNSSPSVAQDGLHRPGMPQSGSSDGMSAQGGQQLGSMSQQQREVFLAQQQRLQQQGYGQSQARPPVPPHIQQRQGFLKSFAQYFHASGQTPPEAIFNNGEREGSFRVGDWWMDVVDLLMAVMKSGGIMAAMQQPPDSPMWRTLLSQKGIPTVLPRPIPCPKPPNSDPNSPPTMTTNPITFLSSAYFAWIQGFETNMQKNRQASYLRQQQAAAAAGRPPPPPPVNPSLMNMQRPGQVDSPSTEPHGTPGSGVPPSPATNTLSFSQQGTSTPTPGSTPTAASSMQPPAAGASRSRKPSGKKDKSLTVNTATPPVDAEVDTPDGSVGGQKRKRGKNTKSEETPAPTPAPEPQTEEPEPPISPSKRQRFRVEYRPIHYPLPTTAGWDPNMVSSTFSKASLRQGTRPIHDLAVVDMEAILMSLRSRMPKELGYAVTVLAMLSMPHPEENIGGLPLHHLREVFMELLELTEEMAFGEEGHQAWLRLQASEAVKKEDLDVETTGARGMDDLNRLPFIELERLGKDFDFEVLGDEEEEKIQWRKEETGGKTKLVLACVNILRNLSMLSENQEIMAGYPELINLLAALCDARLCRLPGEALDKSSKKPFSVMELVRVRRDLVTILLNLGGGIDLRRTTPSATLAVFRVLSSFLASGWESNNLREPIYGPTLTNSIREIGPPISVPSLGRALGAFSLLTHPDSNREVLGSVVPQDELVELFENLLKLLPITKRHFEAMHSLEESLGHYETLALALYSLAFLSPLATRAEMRTVPGSLALITRVIFDTAMQKGPNPSNPFAILCRRLCETLGVLNGTVMPGGAVEGISGMSFGGGGIEGSGWKFASEKVDKGWLAGREESVLAALLGVRDLNWAALGELDGMLWSGGSE
ncbi:hypothetical protein IAR50_002094 [Cryptococcus sp. DSM 104548]